jgi:mannose-6-phosphate isomerase-like protein (cupin superfamily)
MKPALVKRESAEHYFWGENCDGWHLVRDADLSVIEECMPPGTAEVWHRHAKAQQFFYVLSGRGTMHIERETLELSSGDGVWILPGMWHQIRNESQQPVRFLVISQPPSHGDRITD